MSSFSVKNPDEWQSYCLYKILQTTEVLFFTLLHFQSTHIHVLVKKFFYRGYTAASLHRGGDKKGKMFFSNCYKVEDTVDIYLVINYNRVCGVCVCAYANTLCAYVYADLEKKVFHIYIIYKSVSIPSEKLKLLLRPSLRNLSFEYLFTV